MATLDPARIAELLAPYVAGLLPAGLYDQLARYLDLLVLWNGRTNLSAIRDPEQMVTRHFGESLFLAQLLPPEAKTLLDLGSGGGFPGLPIQLLQPSLKVTLAESQGKKASFLREVARQLGLPTEVWSGRAEALLPARRFDVVALRAVDSMADAVRLAEELGDALLLLTTEPQLVELELEALDVRPLPSSRSAVAARCVPRGTAGT